MQFGARHKDGTLTPGKRGAGGALHFTLEAEWSLDPRTGRPRFYGPYIYNSGNDEQAISLRWDTRSAPRRTQNAAKIHLETIPVRQLEQASQSNALLETTATTPRWGVDLNWHGLRLGEEWRLKKA
jgi:hypothetical protein